MHVGHIIQDVKSIVVHTRSNTVVIWHSAVKLITRQFLPSWGLNRVNYAPTHSSALIARGNIRQMMVHVPFGNTDLTGNSILRRHKSSERSKPTQFTYL